MRGAIESAARLVLQAGLRRARLLVKVQICQQKYAKIFGLRLWQFFVTPYNPPAAPRRPPGRPKVAKGRPVFRFFFRPDFKRSF